MPDVDVVIASYGPPDGWGPLVARALDSAYSQSLRGGRVRQLHDPTTGDLSAVRNKAAEGSDAAWLIFLDADDELGAGYVDAMLDAIVKKIKEAVDEYDRVAAEAEGLF